MEEWRSEILKLINIAADQPASHGEWWTSVGIAFAGAVFVLHRATRAMHAPAATLGRCFILLSVTASICIGSAAAIQIRLVPVLPPSVLADHAAGIAAAVVLLLLAVPISALALRSNYLQTAMAIALAITVSMALNLLVHTVARTLRQGDIEVQRTRERTEGIDRMF